MKIDEIFKKMKNVRLGSEKKRNPTRPEVKEFKKFPEKTACPIRHRYGPEYRPLPLLKISQPVSENISIAQERTPMAFCANCNADVFAKWKARALRGKTVESWFVCSICGYEKLKIKYLTREAE